MTGLPCLSDLPAPPPGRSGWPWTSESPRIAGVGWPRITVITPSFQQAAFLEETVRSVLLQGYPDLEYIVVDGGSSDGSVDILRRYEPWITWWCSEPDRGQADALNKGLARATGGLFNWINSDDRLEPETLVTVAKAFRPRVGAVAGACWFVDETSGRREAVRNRRLGDRALIMGCENLTLCQPAVWLRTDRLREVGPFATNLHCYFDAELYIRYLARWPRVAYVERPLALFRIHATSKTVARPDEFRREYVQALSGLVSAATPERVRRRAQLRLQQLGLHADFRRLVCGGAAVQRVGGAMRLVLAHPRPALLRISLRWLLAVIGFLRPPVGDVPELGEVTRLRQLRSGEGDSGGVRR